MPVNPKRIHPKLVDDEMIRAGYLLSQKAHNYVRELQLQHSLNQVLSGQTVKHLSNVLLLPSKHPDLTWPVYIGEKGEAIAIYTKGKLGKGAFGGVYVGVNLDTGEGRAIKIQFPNSQKLLNDIRSEESVLETLSRFDDRFEIKDEPLAKDFVQTINEKELQGLYEPLAKLKIINEQEFKALLQSSNDTEIAKKLIELIRKKYPDNFQQFKMDFLQVGASDYLKTIEMDLAHFKANTTVALFEEVLAEQIAAYHASLAAQMEGVTHFLEIGAQHLAWGVNLAEYKYDEETTHSTLEKLEIAIQMLERLNELHQPNGEKSPYGFVHRDIKMANMMWDAATQSLTVVDMGFTKAMNNGSIYSDGHLCGTPYALAPELIIAILNQSAPVYSTKTEMYAAGVVILDLFAKNHLEIPFQADEDFPKGAVEQAADAQALLEKDPTANGLPSVLEGSAADVLQAQVKEPLKSIYSAIKKMLDINPDTRATFGESLLALREVRARMIQQHSMEPKEPIKSPIRDQESPPQRSTEQSQLKEILGQAIKSIKADMSVMGSEPVRVRSNETRKEFLHKAPQGKQKQLAEYHYWLRQIQALWTQDKMKEDDVKSFIKDLKVELKNDSKLAVHANLQVLKDSLKALVDEKNKENNASNKVKPRRNL